MPFDEEAVLLSMVAVPPQARWIAALAFAVAFAACSSGTAGDDPAAQEPGLEYGATTKCLSQQAGFAYVLQHQIQRLTGKVLSEPDEGHPGATLPLRQALSTIEDRTRQACGDGSTPLVPLIEQAYSRGDEAIDEPQLRRIVDAYEQWRKTVGEPRGTAIIDAPGLCTAMGEQVQASYEVLTRPESGGAKVWVELVVASDWPGLLYLEHGGTIRATRTRPNGADRTYQWGGSSADSAAVRPGRTTRDPCAAGSALGPVPAPAPRRDGSASDVYASAYNTVGPCRIAVPRR